MLYALLAVAVALVGIGVVITTLLTFDPVEAKRERRVTRVLMALGRSPNAVEAAALVAQNKGARKSQKVISPGLRGELEKAGLGRLSPVTYILLLLLVFGGCGFAAPLPELGLPPNVAPVALGGLLAFGFNRFGLRFIAGFRAGRRKVKIMAELPETLDIIVRGLRGGQQVPEAFSSAAAECDGPLGAVIEETMARSRLGVNIEVALREQAERVGMPELGMVAIAAGVAASTGGGLAEALANLSSTLRERRIFKMKVKAISSEGRISGYIIGCLPLIMLVLVSWVAPEHTDKLYHDPRGHMLLGVGALMMGLGVFVISRIVKVKV